MKDKFAELHMLETEREAAFMGVDGAENVGSPWAWDTSFEAKRRNRYADIHPWANNQVKLRAPSGECTYTNASPIHVPGAHSDHDRSYIACQVCSPSLFDLICCPAIEPS